MKMITLLNTNNKPIAINTANILTVYENSVNDGVTIEMIDKSQISIPHVSIEEVVAKINLETNMSDLGKMLDALCGRIQHLEDVIASGLQYVGRSCH